MPHISILPSSVADQIAAGEVVERPASVVKELVENALDAGATAIDVTVTDGGRAIIRVSDDGAGMDAGDAAMAPLRHGTSKIRNAGDLAAIRTYGFRGEALPAIASVSRLEIETATGDGEGTRVVAGPHGVAPVEEVARRRGTTVTVSSLFANAPAREKFLRGSRSEWRAISDVLSNVALTRRDVRLDASHDGKRILTLPAARTLRERVGALWGHDVAARFIEVDDVAGPVRVAGLVERPAEVGTSSRRAFLSVNGRAIRDNGIMRAAEQGYRSTIPAGFRPSLLLELTLPIDAVDVNVHPAKAEVRFLDRWNLERTVERAVRRALGTMESATRWGFSATDTVEAPPDRLQYIPSSSPASGPLFGENDRNNDGERAVPEVDEPIPPLTQLRRTFIMFEHEDGVVLIDQHSAHERVIFERLMSDAQDARVSQRLLLPFTMTANASELGAFDSFAPDLARIGFEIEAFGGNALVVHAVPVLHARFDAERCLRDTLATLAGDRSGSGAAKHEHLLATVACKAAVKAGEPLDMSEMRSLFRDLRDTTLPAHDVHGRATIVRLRWDEIERRFGRA